MGFLWYVYGALQIGLLLEFSYSLLNFKNRSLLQKTAEAGTKLLLVDTQKARVIISTTNKSQNSN